MPHHHDKSVFPALPLPFYFPAQPFNREELEQEAGFEYFKCIVNCIDTLVDMMGATKRLFLIIEPPSFILRIVWGFRKFSRNTSRLL